MGWLEFFEDDDGMLSMGRLMFFASFFPSAFVVISTLDIDALGLFLGAYTGAFAAGKGFDAWQNVKQGKKDDPDSNC